MTASQETTPVAPTSSRAILVATALGLAAAAVVLLLFVLPAEYGIDPLGTGRALGLTALSSGASAPVTMAPAPGGPLNVQSAGLKVDSTEFALLPWVGFVEYHYDIPAGASMVYEWKASGKITFDFHSQPDGKPPEASQSFEKGESDGGRGSFTAPFNGLHGWYWENRTDQVVRITVSTSGFYSSATEYRDDGTSVPHTMNAAPHRSQQETDPARAEP